MDGSKWFCNGEQIFFFQMKEGCKVSCVKIFSWLIYQEVSIYLKYYKPQSIFENSKNVVKSGCFEKLFQCRAPFLFRNKGGI